MSEPKSFSIEVRGLKALIEKLGAATAQETIEQPFFRGVVNMADWSVNNRLTGPRPKFLGVKSGRLRSSISVSRGADRSLTFFIGTNVEYARIHEFGFSGLQTVLSKKGLSFQRFMKMPKRPFLIPAVNQENIDVITKLINTAIEKAMSK